MLGRQSFAIPQFEKRGMVGDLVYSNAKKNDPPYKASSRTDLPPPGAALSEKEVVVTESEPIVEALDAAPPAPGDGVGVCGSC